MRALTLKLYIARHFIIGILGTFAVCALLIFMIDFVEVLRQSGKHGSVPAATLVWLTLLRLPAYTEILLAFAVLVGSIASMLQLSRRSELAVIRAAGMSVWQFISPGIVLAFILGVLTVVFYNPLAASARAQAEELFAEVFGKESNFLKTRAGSWLRQDGADGSSVLNAGGVADGGLRLFTVTIFQFDREGRFVERIEAKQATLQDGYWELQDALVAGVGRQPERYERYLVSTYLTPERVQDALGSVISLSFWQLPAVIDVVERAGLSAAPYRVQYEMLLSRPLLLICMVLFAATVSLKSFRSGGIQTMVAVGMLGGLGFFLLAEVSRQIGVAGLVSPRVAIWAPVIIAALVSTTVLLHQEDG
ncbi:MAG: LPS export ABC transporter permease LptG [Proteobacteria bacterium]|jgi:Predicted permeases|nr:MAG: LPS export ABC transporter permease LptG [Pseudomonadota bacterium]